MTDRSCKIKFKHKSQDSIMGTFVLVF